MSAHAARLALWLAGALLLGCRADPPPALQMADDRSPVLAEPEATPPAPEPEEPARDLWFSTGLGREAILARERRDHDRAAALLDQLLAVPDLPARERAAASLLRGLEHLQREEYGQAAQRLALARIAPSLASISLRVTAWEAQARLDAGQPEVAFGLVESLSPDQVDASPLVGDLLVVRGDAAARQRQPDQAAESYERYLARVGDGRRRFEVMAKLARLRAADPTPEGAARAIELYQQLLLQSPLSDYGLEAEQLLPALRKRAATVPSVKETRAFARSVELARLTALLERRRYRETAKEADRLLSLRSLSDSGRCLALYAKGTAVFKQRQRAAARPIFDRATAVCRAAGTGSVDALVKSRFQAARGRFAEGHHARAAQEFEQLALDHPDHSYADDALVFAGESWAEHGDARRATEAYRRARAVQGDQRDEALRRLLVQSFAAGDAAGALALADEALAGSIADPRVRGKLQYFRGLALHRLGRSDDARAAWLDALRSDPLGYSGLVALARLRGTGADALQAGLAVLADASAQEVPPEASLPPVAERAVLLARLGLGEEARQELDHADIEGWPAAAVLDQAGLYAEAQRIIGNIGQRWRSTPPVPANRRYWELAHPRPFARLVAAGEATHQVPHLLAYAVMQTESRFDPGVTSWAGARGLIQLMPATAKWVAQRAGLEVEPGQLYDPAINLDLGLRYLAGLVQQFGQGDASVPLAVPSYNAGPGAVTRWLDERGDWELDLFLESIPYDETRHYVQSVLGRWWAYRWLYAEGDGRVPAIPIGESARSLLGAG